MKEVYKKLSFTDQFLAMRRRAVPIIHVESADQQAAIRTISKTQKEDTPILNWDITTGLTGVNSAGASVANQFYDGQDALTATGNPGETLGKLTKLPAKSLVFFQNAQYYLNERTEARISVGQGILNLRDVLKAKGATLVLVSPTFDLPAELTESVMKLDEPLPTKDEIKEIVKSIAASAEVKDLSQLDKIADILSGLSAFAAEQTFAVCIKGKERTVDMNMLWDRKCKMIESTPGLSIYRGAETFDDIKDQDNLQDFLMKIGRGKKAPLAIGFFDELEKQTAGMQSDSSGVAQSQHGYLLQFMQDYKIPGIILVGGPGTGKSAVAKAFGNVIEAPTMVGDLGATKSKFVGESEGKLRDMLKVMLASSQGRLLFIATSNNIAAISPELKRRFKSGTFYIDLPSKEGRDLIWKKKCENFGVDADQPRPNDVDWTGAEIEACVEHAYNFGISLIEASQYIVPVAKTPAGIAAIERLRKEANNVYISAQNPGTYKMRPDSILHEAHKRKFEDDEKEG